MMHRAKFGPRRVQESPKKDPYIYIIHIYYIYIKRYIGQFLPTISPIIFVGSFVKYLDLLNKIKALKAGS